MFYKLIIYKIFISAAFSSTVFFNIDMSNIDFPNNDYDNVVINGSWNDWSGWGVTLSDNDGDNIYEGSINLTEGSYQYVIAMTGESDSWSGWGEIINAPIGSSCDYNPDDQWPNYGFDLNENDLTQNYCAGSCNQLCGDSNDSNIDNGNYIMVWNDEFDQEFIDTNKWNFETGNGNWGWGNGEHQYYRPQNAFIEEGILVIEARNENYGGFQYTSTRMQTRNKGDWLYGRIKARIKVPEAGGTWPAFWMMPTNSVYGGWPNSGEIDIMEHYGCDPGDVHATVHNNVFNWNGGTPPTSYSLYTTATSDFHVYEVEWTENELKFFVDDIFIGSYSNANTGWAQWPYNQEFYIILNLAIGSHFMPCQTEDNAFPQRYEIDYVRVYQLSECSLGDISNDGLIDVIDIVQLVDEIVNESDYDSCSDINNDGQLNVIDIVSLVSLIINP